MKAGISRAELVEAYSMSAVQEVYGGPLALTNLKWILGTRGDIWVIRGDLEPHVHNAKGFVAPYLFKRVEAKMRECPGHSLFDGVGPSSLEAHHFFAQLYGRRMVFVVAREDELPPHVASWQNTEIIRADEIAEWGYVRKQAEVLHTRKDIIPLRQAEYGAWAMARIGNRVVRELEARRVRPDASVWVAASGSNLWGIGGKLKDRFSSETILVTKTVHVERGDLYDENKMRTRAREMLRQYSFRNPSVSISEADFRVSPLHMVLPSLSLLRLIAHTGKPGLDQVEIVTDEERERVQEHLRLSGFDWTGTTAMALVKAIQLANEGKTVVAMVYGVNQN